MSLLPPAPAERMRTHPASGPSHCLCLPPEPLLQIPQHPSLAPRLRPSARSHPRLPWGHPALVPTPQGQGSACSFLSEAQSPFHCRQETLDTAEQEQPEKAI